MNSKWKKHTYDNVSEGKINLNVILSNKSLGLVLNNMLIKRNLSKQIYFPQN